MEKQSGHQTLINNAFYDDLGKSWVTGNDHPVALLRKENAARSPWVADEIAKRKGAITQTILDIGCGGGFLTNYLADLGHEVTGIDLSLSSLEIAKEEDKTNSVLYLQANAYNLPFEDESFEVVTAMDILEHVEKPELLIKEASRVLKKGGLFLFHTFNRNFLSYLVVIKGVEWFVKNTPRNMHVYSLFLSPKEVKTMCQRNNLHVEKISGLVPDIRRAAFWKMLLTRKVPENFSFTFVENTLTGYCGVATQEIDALGTT